MTFAEQLNEYMESLNVAGNELARASGLSTSLISIWRTGKRSPRRSSDSLLRLAEGIVELSGAKGSPLEKETIVSELNASLAEKANLIPENLNALLNVLQITSVQIGKLLSFHPAYISQIRMGIRSPADPVRFSEEISRYVLRRYKTPEERGSILRLLNCPPAPAADAAELHQRLTKFLLDRDSSYVDYLSRFLVALDRFDLNDYLRSIHFQEITVPAGVPAMPERVFCYGVEEMKTGELCFFGETARSASKESVFMCGNMPMADMGRDTEFSKKWMMSLAAALKQGLHFDVVHSLDRPFEEMMLGLESWIPLYMTGQVSPLYLTAIQSKLFRNMLYVSGAAALSGECIADMHSHGRYYLTKEERELAYFRQRSEDILKRAKPLMEIYRKDGRKKFLELLKKDAEDAGQRHNILSTPPLYTMTEDLLSGILDRVGVPRRTAEEILEYAAVQKKLAEQTLETSAVFDEIPQMEQEEFSLYPPVLALSGLFLSKDIHYTYEEYAEHIRQTAKFADAHENYTFAFTAHSAFRNIQIQIHEGDHVIISKNQSPTIHFVIRHPKLRAALENMIVPVVE